MILNFFWQLFFDVSLMEGTYLEISQKNYYFKDPVIFFLDENFSSRTSSRKYYWSAAMCPISKSTKSLHPIKGWGRWRGRRGGVGVWPSYVLCGLIWSGEGGPHPTAHPPARFHGSQVSLLLGGKKWTKRNKKWEAGFCRGHGFPPSASMICTSMSLSKPSGGQSWARDNFFNAATSANATMYTVLYVKCLCLGFKMEFQCHI